MRHVRDSHVRHVTGWFAGANVPHCAKPAAFPLVGLQGGAKPNIQNERGETTLMWAARNGYRKCARLLLDAGADPNIHDCEGKTALDYAQNDEMRKVLQGK